MTRPVLWHIPVSHYSEKARWALAYKGVAHERRAPPPPVHMAVALALTRGKHYTFPVLRLDGACIGDSSAIIEALERAFPEPTLYPEDPNERRRALELEEWFDENLGPHIRRYAFHEITHDRERLEEFAVVAAPGPLARARGLMGRGARTFLNVRFGVKGKKEAAEARERVLQALDRLESELEGREYLAGNRFSVADLTAAALFYPLVLPPEGPQILKNIPEAIERFRAPLQERPGCRWVAEMFRRHR